MNPIFYQGTLAALALAAETIVRGVSSFQMGRPAA
jgi:hypothetical protein